MPVTILHTDCLQHDMSVAPSGQGALAVVLRREIHIQSPCGHESICLPTWTPLLGIAQVDDLNDAVRRHLCGGVTASDLRLGVSLLTGHDPSVRPDHPDAALARSDIDDWLGQHTAFLFWPRTGSESAVEEGFFAGVARSWASQTLPLAGTYPLHSSQT